MMEKAAGPPPTSGASPNYEDYAMEAALLEAQQKKHSKGMPGTHEPFPVQLHWVLEQTEKDGYSHVVRWAPHGRAFVVHQRDLFVEKILPVYFNQTKFTSFQRQLSLYGFRRLSKGPDRGGYYHPKFLRISRTFTRNITRTKVKNEGPRKAATPEAEPNFYQMPKLSDSIARASSGTRRPSSGGGGEAQSIGNLKGQGQAEAQTQTQHLIAAAAARMNEPTMQSYAGTVPPIRLNSSPLDPTESRLTYQAILASPLLSQRLPRSELDHARLLTSQLQQQQHPSDGVGLRHGISGNVPTLPTLSSTTLPVLSSTLQSAPAPSPSSMFLPTLPAHAAQSHGMASSTVPPNITSDQATLSDLLALQSNNTFPPQRTSLLARAALSGTDQAPPPAGASRALGGLDLSSAATNPPLSEAIARILGVDRSNQQQQPGSGNPDLSRGGRGH